MNARAPKNLFAALLLCSLALAAAAARAQEPEPAAAPQSSTQQQTLPSSPRPQLDSLALENRTDANWRHLPKNFVQDQKDLWLFPVEMGKGRHLLPSTLVIATTAALIATDPQTEPHFRRLDAFQDTSGAFGSKVSGG